MTKLFFTPRSAAVAVSAMIITGGVAVSSTAWGQTHAATGPTTQPTTRAATRPSDNGDDEIHDMADRLGGSLGSRVGERLRKRGDDDHQPDNAAEGRDERGRRDGRSDSDRREPTEEEWQETVAFLEAHAPHRLAMYENFIEWIRDREEARENADRTNRAEEDDRPRRSPESMIRFARSRIFHRVESLQRLDEEDPELYAFAVRQFELEDEIYGIMLDVRRAKEAEDEAAIENAQSRARDAMSRYAQNTLAERESRIQRLRDELAREQERLERDRRNIDEMIRRLEKRFGDALPPDDARRRRGDGDGPRRGPGGDPANGGRDGDSRDRGR